MGGSAATYDILATGLIDTFLSSNPTTTFFKSKYSKATRFSLESVSQPFNTATVFGSESQVLLNRVGDMVYFLYLKVDLCGIQACDPKSEQCAGLVNGGQFPSAMDAGGACNPSKAADEAALIEYLPSDFNDLTAEQQLDALREAKDKWLSVHYGAAREKSCCTNLDSDCPDQHCPEVGDL